MPTRQVLPVSRPPGVGRGGHRIDDLNYCPICQLYFVNTTVFKIHRDLHSVKFDTICSFCGERMRSVGEFALHLLLNHVGRRQEATESSESDCTAASTPSKRTRKSNEPSPE